MSNVGFTAIRNGILEHIDEGKFCLRSIGVYTYLHLRKHWLSGVVWTNSASIATSFGEKKTTIQALMRNLKDNGYITYPKGFGKKGNYPVCLINDQPPHGKLKGYRLSGFTDESCTHVYYEPVNGQHTERVLRLYGGWADARLMMGGACALVMPLLDIRQSRLLDSEDEISKIELYGATPEPSNLQSKKVGV